MHRESALATKPQARLCRGFPPPRPLQAIGSSAGIGDETPLLQPVHHLDDGTLYATSLTLGRRTAKATHRNDVALLLGLACREIGACTTTQLSPSPLLVSLPAGALLEWGEDLPELVGASLEHHGADASLLEICLSEAPHTIAGVQALLALSALRDIGVGVGLDQFALPAAGANLLPRMPITSLRLHPSVAYDLPHSRDMRAALTALIRSGHDQDASIVALGVQTALQRDILTDLGCDYASGRLFGPPMPAPTFHSATAH